METIRYSQISRDDIRFGHTQFEVTLADGRVVMLNEVDLGYVIARLTGLNTFATVADLPASDATYPGRIARVSADAKVYIDTGSAWKSIAIPAVTAGSVLFGSSTGIAEDNSNFYFDDTNNRLGVGTNSNVTERIVIPNASYYGGVNQAGSAAKKLIGLDASDHVDIGNGGTAVDPNGALTAKQSLDRKRK